MEVVVYDMVMMMSVVVTGVNVGIVIGTVTVLYDGV